MGRVPFRRVPFRRVPFRRVPFRKVPFRRVPFRRVPFRRVNSCISLSVETPVLFGIPLVTVCLSLCAYELKEMSTSVKCVPCPVGKTPDM